MDQEKLIHRLHMFVGIVSLSIVFLRIQSLDYYGVLLPGIIAAYCGYRVLGSSEDGAVKTL